MKGSGAGCQRSSDRSILPSTFGAPATRQRDRGNVDQKKIWEGETK